MYHVVPKKGLKEKFAFKVRIIVAYSYLVSSNYKLVKDFLSIKHLRICLTT